MADPDQISKAAELAIGGAVTLATTFIGAFAAFRFNRLHQKDMQREQRIEACNQAMLALYQQFNTLSNYRDQVLDKHRDSPGRHLQVRASAPFAVDYVSVNIATLAFLISTEAREVPAEIALLQAKYRSCLELINLRSSIHLNEYQPTLEAEIKHLGTVQSIPGEMAEQMVGQRIVGILRQATDDIFDQVYGTIDAYTKAGSTLKEHLKKAMTGAPIIGFSPMQAPVQPLERPQEKR